MASLVWLPAFFILWFSVLFFGVNIPYFDDWQFWLGRLDILLGIGEFDLLTAVWTKYPPHFIPFTQIALILFSKLGWGPHALMVVHTAFGFFSAWLFFQALFHLYPSLIEKRHRWFTIALGFLFFSFCQREVWFFAFNIHFSLILFFLSMAFYALVFQKNVLYWSSLIGAIGAFTPWLCLVLAGISILFPKWKKRKSAIVFHSILVICGLLLSRFWESTENITSTAGNAGFDFSSVLLSVLFFLRLLGGPFIMLGGPYQNPFFHAIAILLGFFFCFLLFRQVFFLLKKKNADDFAPVFIPLFSILSAFLLTAGRAQSLDYAGAASRYTLLILPGWICLLIQLRLMQSQKAQSSTSIRHAPVSVGSNSIGQISFGGLSGIFAVGLVSLGLGCSLINAYAEVFVRRPKLLNLQRHIQEVYHRDYPRSSSSSEGSVNSLDPVNSSSKTLIFHAADREEIYRYHWHKEAIDGMLKRIEIDPDKYWFFFCGGKYPCSRKGSSTALQTSSRGSH